MSINSSSKYQPSALMSLIGLLLVASPLLWGLPRKFQKASLVEGEEMERFRMEQRQKTVNMGIIPSFRRLKVVNYVDNSRRKPKLDIRGYLNDELVMVYDANGICIGRIENRTWKWKHHYKNVCKVS